MRRGIAAAPVLNGFCGDYEYGMEKSVIFDQEFNYGWPFLQTLDNSSVILKKLSRFILIIQIIGGYFLYF